MLDAIKGKWTNDNVNKCRLCIFVMWQIHSHHLALTLLVIHLAHVSGRELSIALRRFALSCSWYHNTPESDPGNGWYSLSVEREVEWLVSSKRSTGQRFIVGIWEQTSKSWGVLGSSSSLNSCCSLSVSRLEDREITRSKCPGVTCTAIRESL